MAINPRIEFYPEEGTQKVDSLLAGYWLNNFNYEHQRRIRAWHVKNLAKEIEAGRFLDKTSIHFCFCTADQTYHLVNGQHTLSAITLSGAPCRLMVVIYECRSMDEVADYFSRFDTHLTRQLSDSLSAHQVDVHFGLTKSQLEWVSAASLFYSFMTGSVHTRSAKQITNDEKLNLVLKHGDLAIKAMNLTDGFHNFTWVRRKTSLACAMIMVSFDHDEALSFWRGMAEDDGLRKGDPRKALLDLFKVAVTTGGSYSSMSGRKPIPDAGWLKAISSAWNAIQEGRQLQYVRYTPIQKTVTFEKIGTFKAA